MAAKALRTVLGRMGFTPQAATILMTEQGMGDLAEFTLLMDEEAENFCMVTHRPRGTIANPDADEDRQPDRIPNAGLPTCPFALKTT